MQEKYFEGMSSRAMLRYQVVSQVEKNRLGGDKKSLAIAKAALCAFYDPVNNDRLQFNERTIYRLMAAYKKGSIASLETKKRRRDPKASIYSPQFVSFLCSEKLLDPAASTPELIKRARLLGIIGVQEKVNRTTVYRLCDRLNLPIAKRISVRTNDMRRFAYPIPMTMVLVDGKHFKVGPASVKRMVFTFLDDTSRTALACVVGSAENSALLLRGLDIMLRKFGKPEIMFLDRGPGFISTDTARCLASLGIKLVLGTKAYPEGHGKIERYHRTLIKDLLRSFDKNPEIDPGYKALEHRISHYLNEDYNLAPHGGEGLDGMSPTDKFFSKNQPLRMIDDLEAYEKCFVLSHVRRVSADNIVSFKKLSLEMPSGYALRKVTIFHNTLSRRVYVIHEGRLVQILPVDLAANAVARRSAPERHTPSAAFPTTAANINYLQSYAGLTDAEGNAVAPSDDEDENYV